MRLLWPRTARGQCCRCRTCSDILARISSRSAPRRKPTFAEAFTACYSGIFAFSTIVDSKLKDARRQELDKAMDDAITELAALQTEREQLEKTKLRDYESRVKRTRAVFVNADDVTVHERAPYHPASMYGALYALVNDASRIFDRAPMDDPYTRISELGLDTDLSYLTREALRYRARTDFASLENAVAATRDPRLNPWYSQRKALSRGATKTTEDATANCVDQMLHPIAYGVFKNNGSPEPTSANLPAWLRPVWEARAEGYPWNWWRHTNSRDLTRQLIQASYTDTGPAHVTYVAQVCYSLLTMRGEVEADKLNAVVLCMDRLGMHQVSKVIIGRFFHEFHLRPTPHSVVSFLNHYKVTASPLQFYSLFRHMVGDHDEGYKLFRTKISDFRNAPWWFVKRWHVRYSLTQYKDSVLARVAITRSIAGAVLEGLLHFEMVDHAVEFFLAALDDMVLVAPYLLGLLADHCLGSLNWRTAMRLVQGLATYPREISKLLIKSSQSEGLASRLERLFDMCGVTESAPLMHLNIDPAGLRHLRVAIWAKHMEEASGRSLWRDYYGKIAPTDTGFRAAANVQWSSAAIFALRLFGVSKQLHDIDENIEHIDRSFLDLTRPKKLTRTSIATTTTAATTTTTQLQTVRLEVVARQLEHLQQSMQQLARDYRETRIAAVAMHIDNIERDLSPLQQRLFAISGIAMLRRIQEAELYHVQLETELLRIHNTATSMRFRLAQLEMIQLRMQASSLLASWPPAAPQATPQHKYAASGLGSKQNGDASQQQNLVDSADLVDELSMATP